MLGEVDQSKELLMTAGVNKYRKEEKVRVFEKLSSTIQMKGEGVHVAKFPEQKTGFFVWPCCSNIACQSNVLAKNIHHTMTRAESNCLQCFLLRLFYECCFYSCQPPLCVIYRSETLAIIDILPLIYSFYFKEPLKQTHP